jgi:2-polyprenyl-3-methyl-5-hydroxy-6-metoxy-1,4-benzoquinol methylase
MTPQEYNLAFFKLQQSQSYQSAKKILPTIIDWIKPVNVADVGCGVGAWLKAFKDSGINKVTGYDGSYVKTENLLIDKEEFIIADLEKKLTTDVKYDLLVCLEVAEHLTPNRSTGFIEDITQMSDIILFSAAIPGQEGTFHINEQYPAYWINIFNKNGYECFDCIRPLIWNMEEIEFWYKQNIMLFIKNSCTEKYSALKNLASYSGNTMVHSKLFEYKNSKIDNFKKILRNPLRILRYFIKGI